MFIVVGLFEIVCFVKNEVFGLVLYVVLFDDEEEVIVLVNDMVYGFGISIWMENISCVYCVVLWICVGYVWINFW